MPRALDRWLSAQAHLAEALVTDPRVQDRVTALIALSHRTGGDAAALARDPAQASLAGHPGARPGAAGTAGYFILEPGGTIVARAVDERVGDRTVLAVADANARALSGKPTFLPPTLKQKFASTPMAFVLVPIRDGGGTPFAVFAFRIDPAQVAAVVNPGPARRVGRDVRPSMPTRASSRPAVRPGGRRSRPPARGSQRGRHRGPDAP
jgi:hypothetical protein